MRTVTLKYAALLAFRNSVGIFLTPLVLLPFFSIFDRIFYHRWYLNWVLSLKVSAALTLVVFGFFFVAQLLETQTAEHRERIDRLVFPAAMWLRGLYLTGIVMGVGLPVGMYREGDRGWVLYVPAVFILLGYFPWPRAIRLGGAAISKRNAFLRVTRIPYREIERVVVDPSRGEVVIFGKNGENIVHTNMHVDEERLINRLQSIMCKEATVLGG